MAAKMTVYYKKNIRKYFLRLCRPILSRSLASDSVLPLFSSLCFSWPSFFSGLLIFAKSSSSLLQIRPQILSVSGLSVNLIMPRLPCPYLIKVVSINMSLQIASWNMSHDMFTLHKVFQNNTWQSLH